MAALILLIVLLAVGTLGYELIEGWSFLESLYMTVITIATIGFKEVHNLSPRGMLFTIFIAIVGVGTAAYALSSLTETMIGAQISEIIGRRRVQKEIDKMRNHHIVCGYGRMGSLVCRELKAQGKEVVVVESSEAQKLALEKDNMLYIIGDVTDDAVLTKAGIERAKALVAAVRTDADNLYLVITARQLNPNLYIVSRAADETAERKLIRAGANRVVSPYHIGALRMAQAVLRPAVVDFLDLTVRAEKQALRMEGLHVSPSSKLTGLTLKDSKIRENLGLIIIAIKKADGNMILNPLPDTKISGGDILITAGEISALTNLERILNPEEKT